MNDAIKIQLSAFVDGELPENESELLLRRLSQDGVLRQQVAEYMQLGRLLRGDREINGMNQLRARIAAELGTEAPSEIPVEKFAPSRYFRPVAGVAIAAFVAVAALVGLQQVGGVDDVELAAGRADFAAVAIDDSSMYTEQLSNEFVSERPNDRLAQYFLRHEERSAGSGASFLPRLVNLEQSIELELREGKLIRIEPRIIEGQDNDNSGNVEASDSSESAGN